MEQFIAFQLVNRRNMAALFIPIHVLRDTVWEYLTYPHERRGKFVSAYNKCLLSLPKPRIFPGPRIIYNSREHNTAENGCLVKFIYTLHHAKNPSSYITVHEITTYPSPTELDWYQLSKHLRNNYIEGLPKTSKSGGVVVPYIV